MSEIHDMLALQDEINALHGHIPLPFDHAAYERRRKFVRFMEAVVATAPYLPRRRGLIGSRIPRRLKKTMRRFYERHPELRR